MPNHSRLLSSASYLGQEGFRTMTPLSLVVRGDRRVAESFSAARQCRLLVSLLTHKQSSGNAATVPFFGTSKTHRHSRCRLSNLSDLVPFMETKPRLLESLTTFYLRSLSCSGPSLEHTVTDGYSSGSVIHVAQGSVVHLAPRPDSSVPCRKPGH